MRTSRLKSFVIGLLLVGALGNAGNSSASGWWTSGAVNFTATTSAIKLVDNTTGAGFVCSGTTTANGLLAVLSQISGTATGLRLAALQPTFSDCTLGSLAPVTLSCTALGSMSPLPASLNGTSWVAGTGISPSWYGSTTTGSITGVTCTINIPNCRTQFSGSVVFTYMNPTASAAGRLTVLEPGQSLTVANGGGATCTALRINNGDSMSFADTSGMSTVYTVMLPALANQPRVWLQ